MLGQVKKPILNLAMLVGMACGLAVPLGAQDHTDLQTYLSEQNVTLPSGLEECKQKRDPRSFLYCM